MNEKLVEDVARVIWNAPSVSVPPHASYLEIAKRVLSLPAIADAIDLGNDGWRSEIERSDEHSPCGPLGALTGEAFQLILDAEKVGDAQLLAFARWMHERVCLARYQLRKEPWPQSRRMPDKPAAQPLSPPPSAKGWSKEVKRLRRDCAELYQVIGTMAEHCPNPDDAAIIKALDNASDAANGDPRRHDDLLPFILPPAAQEGWRTMESAPRDGTRILGIEPDGFVETMYWVESVWVSREGAWVNCLMRSDTHELNPTHWRPLPPPP